MSDEINEAEVRQTRDVATRMHETNEAKRTEYRMDPGLAAASLTWALDALDAERARVAEWTAEARERDAEVARWQSEARDLGRALADVRQRCGGYPDSRVDGDGGIVAVVVRERDEALLVRTRDATEATDKATEYLRRAMDAERERDEALITCAKLERAIKMNAATHERRMPVPDSDALRARAEQAERERDEAQAALVALREAAMAISLAVLADGLPVIHGAGVLNAALAATPATLAGQVRARVLREAVATVERWLDTDDDPLSMIDRLRAIADESERAK